ncbi:MAG: pyruvate formate-lyase activating enzyme [Deltaproteobacteria bacterium]|nr:pyruvate formate-lyase activating enzyme [Deltaproteobacteria bacterium]
MSRFLLIDIGAGTMDVLYYDTKTDLHYKAVVKSPVRYMAEKAADISKDLLVTGVEMGGGPISHILRQKAEKFEVVMTPSSAATLNHNPDKVRSWGIRIVEDAEITALLRDERYALLTIGDIEPERIRNIVEAFGVAFSFDTVGVCAQDHGTPPDGMSHLDYRHQIFKQALDRHPFPHALLYRNDEIPPTLNRLRSIAEGLERFPTDDIYVMDSGMAAILGSSMDPLARSKGKTLVLDVATSHTLGAALEGEELAGFFEYHTHDITVDRLDDLLQKLADGELVHEKILEQGGHGAYTRKRVGFDAIEAIVSTGPKRRLAKGSRLPITPGAPLGDNMMTGTVGLLEAIRRRNGLKPISYR